MKEPAKRITAGEEEAAPSNEFTQTTFFPLARIDVVLATPVICCIGETAKTRNEAASSGACDRSANKFTG